MPEVATKMCSKCRNKYPATIGFFHRSKTGKYGLQCYCRTCASSNERKANKRKHDQNYRRLHKYGINLEQWRQMAKVQDSKCAICGREETQTQKGKTIRLAIDHNHSTGELRALLCHNCNIGLDNFKEDEELLLKAVLYLKKWGR